ncbi:MAG TPA: helix-turn-helix domain-containing protein [Mycobacteriales bacterium]|nr:helix-turn-helix domain-containing protein [Mycobacteriales bacterium]
MSDDARSRTHLGDRVRHYRLLRGLSLRVCADLAGISAGWLSRVERGERSLERRSHIEALAAALQVSASELLGLPYQASDRDHSAAHAELEGVRRVLIGTDLGGDGALETWRPLAELERMAADARVALCRFGDVTTAAAGLTGLLAELHAHVAHGDRDRALRALAFTGVTASTVVSWLGSPELSWMAAGRAREAARALGDPTMIGLAEWRAVGAARPYSIALSRVEAAASELEDTVGEDTERIQVLGMLHLHASMDSAVVGKPDTSRAHFAAATELAGRTVSGTDPFELYFGPENLAVWQLSIAVELGEPGRARAVARTLPAGAISSRMRRATYYQDLGRALAVDTRWREAAEALLTAERLSPAEIRVNALARGLAMDLLPRLPRAAGGIEIRALALRMGIIT